MNIKNRVNTLARRYKTRNPLEIAEMMNCIVVRCPLKDIRGFYHHFQRNNIIYVDENLPEHLAMFVIAHELGHILLHKKDNAIFMDSKTLFNQNKLEIQANKFAIELLIADDDIREYSDFTVSQLSRIFGYEKSLIELRLQDK